MKKKSVFFFLFLFCSILMVSKSNPWGNLKKIYFHDSAKKYSKVLSELKAINFEEISRNEQKEIARHLIKFGDYYFSKKETNLAKAFYNKVVNLSPEYWYIYNKLEKMNREKGEIFPDFKNVFTQLGMTLKDFKSSFLIFNTFFNNLFFSGILVFFIFSIALFIRYFRLAGYDLLFNEKGGLSIPLTAFVILVLIWPIFVLSGWFIYPFLISGFLWVYLSNTEKKALLFILILISVMSLFYSLNLSFERKINSKDFRTTQNINNGKLYDKDDYDRFDDEIKVLQAFSYYEKKQPDTALDILLSTGESYRSVLKYNLMGNIYFRSGDIPASIRNYKESLNLDDKNDTTLNNFTLALLRERNSKAFDLWSKRYPGLKKYKNAELELKEVNKVPGVLWKRLFNISGQKFNFPIFLKNVFSEFFKIPVIYYILLFIAYAMLIQKMYPNLGDSTYCSKCSKTIKKTLIHRSYKLCEECHQLFLIKDVIFLEAKVLKEKELNRRFKKKYMIILLLSILIPGLNLNYRNKKWLFVLLTTIIYLLLGFSIIGIITFNKIFSTSPIFFNFVGVAAVILFFLVNLFSVLGEENGI